MRQKGWKTLFNQSAPSELFLLYICRGGGTQYRSLMYAHELTPFREKRVSSCTLHTVRLRFASSLHQQPIETGKERLQPPPPPHLPPSAPSHRMLNVGPPSHPFPHVGNLLLVSFFHFCRLPTRNYSNSNATRLQHDRVRTPITAHLYLQFLFFSAAPVQGKW